MAWNKVNGRKLLSRSEFKRLAFQRDGGKCVFCGKPAIDAHHILDRKLFDDGGYYLDNAASVCNDCHLDCEKSIKTVKEVRIACGISTPILPKGFDEDCEYDKWGRQLMRESVREFLHSSNHAEKQD